MSVGHLSYSGSSTTPPSTESYGESFRLPPTPKNVVLNQIRYCRCPNGPEVAEIRMSSQDETRGRMFFCCKHFIDRERPGCGFFLWAVDEGVATRVAEDIAQLQSWMQHSLLDYIDASIDRVERDLSSKFGQLCSEVEGLKGQLVIGEKKENRVKELVRMHAWKTKVYANVCMVGFVLSSLYVLKMKMKRL